MEHVYAICEMEFTILNFDTALKQLLLNEKSSNYVLGKFNLILIIVQLFY